MSLFLGREILHAERNLNREGQIEGGKLMVEPFRICVNAAGTDTLLWRIVKYLILKHLCV